jgi:Outer membrane protein beta-barrel domain
MRIIVRTLAIGFVVFLSALGAQAQVQVGFRGGANAGLVSTPSELASIMPTIHPSFGPTGGLFLDIPLGGRVSLRPEIDYIQKGFEIQEGVNLNLGGFNLPLGARIAYQSQELEVPLLLKVNLADAGGVQPYLLAGPAVSYAVDGRIRTRATALFTSQPMDVDLNYGGMLSRWDVSAIGGLGLSVPAGAGSIFGEARYELGFTRQIQVPVVNVNVRNRGVSVALGYSFPIGW